MANRFPLIVDSTANSIQELPSGDNLDLSGSDIANVGNVNISGNLYVSNSLVTLGGGVNKAPLTSNDGKDRGTLLDYYSGSQHTGFMGWKNSSGEFTFASNATVANNVVTVTQLGNVRADYFYGNFVGAITGNLAVPGTNTAVLFNEAGNASASDAFLFNRVSNTAILSNALVVGGNITAGNIKITGSVSAGDTTITGNLTVVGSTVSANVTTLNVKDPIIEQGGNPTGTLSNDDGLDRGQLLHYYDGVAKDAFMGMKNSTKEFTFASNVSIANNVVTINQLGNLLAGNANLGNAVTANYFVGDGSLLTGINSMANLSVSGTATLGNAEITGTANIGTLNVTGQTNLGDVSNVHISGGSLGQVLTTDGSGNLVWANTQASIISNIANIVAGSAIDISIDYSNINYPAGVFTLNQLGPVSLTMVDIWASGANAKNAYANYIANTVNTQNVSITLSLANASFNVQATDSITIGTSTVTGANLTGLGITGTGGTYTIPSSYLNANAQIVTSSVVSANLSTSRGVKTATGATLTNNQPTPFSVNSLTGSFPSSSVPFWNVNQTFNWSASVTGTVSSGNVTYGGNATGTLTSVGATSGVSPSLDSTLGYSVTSTDYTGAGLNGAGTRTIPSTVSSTITPATKYYPIFWKTTASSSNPNITSTDSHNSNNYALGQGANTTSTASNYLWIATPNSTSHTFAFTFLGATVAATPDQTYTNQTISGQTYNVYGFTNYSAVTTIYTAT